MAAALLTQRQVKVHACEQSIGHFQALADANNNVDVSPATEQDWHEEYLAMEIAIRVVEDYDTAVAHIQQYGSDHTEVICTQDYSVANRFTEINSSVVMVNASSRFSDGGELGLGAEIGISTSKLHAFGSNGGGVVNHRKICGVW